MKFSFNIKGALKDTPKTVKKTIKIYFMPIKTLVLFMSIPFEMLRQMSITLIMDSDEHEQLQEMKFQRERDEMSKKDER